MISLSCLDKISCLELNFTRIPVREQISDDDAAVVGAGSEQLGVLLERQRVAGAPVLLHFIPAASRGVLCVLVVNVHGVLPGDRDEPSALLLLLVLVLLGLLAVLVLLAAGPVDLRVTQSDSPYR